MSRKSEFQSNYEKPASKYLDWSSDDKCFKYWDGQAKQSIELPIKFLVLKEAHTVKGWHDKSKSGIWSNEIKNIGSDILEVKAFKGGILAKGVYKEIKEIINNVGGHYSKSIYVMLQNGETVNIQLKGSAVQSWGDTFQKSRARMSDEWITCFGSEELQKGKVKYSIPLFKFEGSLNAQENDLADKCYNNLVSALESKISDNNEEIEDNIEELLNDNIDF